MANLIERVKKLRLGYGNEKNVDVGPCISENQRNTVDKYVQIGINEDKAKLETGGEFASEGNLAKDGFISRQFFQT